ncbi:hypothetical protein GCM10009808_08150 [Microbacterium sediminicola]|uniref:Shikimate kinase n=1 Tax=Microbacterium sediminicola TaxID=415210 RepID=A0ABN2HTW5_9MICO
MPVSRPLVLVGPMGAGKTSVGRRVARRLGVEFVDTDASVQRVHGPIEQIFADQGEDVFRGYERDAVRDALSAPRVVSLGGGAVLDADTQADLERCDVVLLTVAPRVVATRVQGSTRPLLRGDDALAEWSRIFAERRPVYERVASLRLDTSDGPLQHTVDEIVHWVHAQEETA